MSNIKHTPEPWRVGANEDFILAGDELICFGAYRDLDSADALQSKVDAARIVACVNALAGIEDPEAFVQQAKASIAKDKFPFT